MADSPEKNIAWADAEIANYRAKIADLEGYKRVERSKISAPPTVRVSLLEAVNEVAKAVEPVMAPALQRAIERQRGAKKITILDILAGSPNGLPTSAIVTECRKRGLLGTEVSNTSPQLSAFASQDLIRLEGGLWKIRQQGREYLAQKI